MTVTSRVHIGVRVDSQFFGFVERRNDLSKVESTPDNLHNVTHLLLVVGPLSFIISLSNLLADRLDVNTLYEHSLH